VRQHGNNPLLGFECRRAEVYLSPGGAASIACPRKSNADVQGTRQLREASGTMDIELLDHVALGEAAADPLGLGYYSFRQAGIL